MRIKDWFFLILIALGIIGFILFLAGIPGEETSFYEHNTIVCKKWGDNWSLGQYPNRKCWKLEEIK